MRNIQMMHLLERIAAKFNREDISLMVLKGAALNLTLYQDPSERPMGDLDLLVKPQDLDKATAALEELGHLRSQILVREDFFPRFYYEIEYTAGKINPVTIDLHVRPLRPLRWSRFIPVDALWRRAQTVAIGTATIQIPSTTDMLLHLATHSAVHGNARQVWLQDLRDWTLAHQHQIDWQQFTQTAHDWRLGIPALRAIQAAEHELGHFLPDVVAQRLSLERTTWRDRLALWQAPRDNEHPIAHVLVNAVCTPGWRFVMGYLLAVLTPGRQHMEEVYHARHPGWLLCAHLLRYLGPIVKRVDGLRTRLQKFEVQESSIHGNGVFATRRIALGELIAHYRVAPVDTHSPYVISHTERAGQIERLAIIGRLRFLNHSCRATAEISNLKLTALRPIRAGEEITIDYGEGACDCKRAAA